MKKLTTLTALLLALSMTALTGCSSKTEDPGAPPSDVINQSSNSTGGNTENKNNASVYEGDVLKNAVSVVIGKQSTKEWTVDMYNNAASQTMLGYLSDTGLMFPTYTYEEEAGFVAQSVRGSYTRDDETTVTDVKAGELYLFSDGQLRFYFKDVSGANITATPIGYYIETEGLTDAVIDAYQSNIGDSWGVDVYFLITKTI